MDIAKVVEETFAKRIFSVTIHVAADEDGLISGAQVSQPEGSIELSVPKLARTLAEVSALQSVMLEQITSCLPKDVQANFRQTVECISADRRAKLMQSGNVSVVVKT